MTECALWQSALYDRVRYTTECVKRQSALYDRVRYMTECVIWQSALLDRAKEAARNNFLSSYLIFWAEKIELIEQV